MVFTLLLPLGSYAAEAESNPPIVFEDVSPDDWFYPYVQFLYTNNIMHGVDGEAFAPDAMFTRAQVAATLFRLHYVRTADTSDSRNSNFTDISENDWFAPYVTWASILDIILGIGDNRFAPNDAVDRQQFAVILYRFADAFTNIDTSVQQGRRWSNFRDRNQIASWAVDGLTWANYHDIVAGRNSWALGPTDTVLRSEAAAMLARFIRLVRLPTVDDFKLTISVEETTLPKGENFRVLAELTNTSDKDLEIAYMSLFFYRIPGYHPIHASHIPPIYPRIRVFEAGSTISQSFSLYTDAILSQGTHELIFNIGFYTSWVVPFGFGNERITWDIVSSGVWIGFAPDSIILTVR
jgi:hypothetical protein